MIAGRLGRDLNPGPPEYEAGVLEEKKYNLEQVPRPRIAKGKRKKRRHTVKEKSDKEETYIYIMNERKGSCSDWVLILV
jgi:hypothetical protein